MTTDKRFKSPEEYAKIEQLRNALLSGCSEEEFLAMRCPECGSEFTFHVHPDDPAFFLLCNRSGSHVAMTVEAPEYVDWWKKYISDVWY